MQMCGVIQADGQNLTRNAGGQQFNVRQRMGMIGDLVIFKWSGGQLFDHAIFHHAVTDFAVGKISGELHVFLLNCANSRSMQAYSVPALCWAPAYSSWFDPHWLSRYTLFCASHGMYLWLALNDQFPEEVSLIHLAVGFSHLIQGGTPGRPRRPALHC